MRIVIATNMLISAIFWTGKPKLLLNMVRHGKLALLSSEILLGELKEVFMREDKPFRLSLEEADRIVTAI